jgi:hypothetical protein
MKGLLLFQNKELLLTQQQGQGMEGGGGVGNLEAHSSMELLHTLILQQSQHQQQTTNVQ